MLEKYFIRGVERCPEWDDIVNTYKPDVIWSDGDWEMPDTYWKSKEFLAWLYNSSPVKDSVVVNDRWGSGDACHHGGYWTCNDRYNPHQLQNHKWENCMTIDYTTWGYARNHDLSFYLSIEELIESLASTVAYGGNLLLNVGPTADGMITPIYEERLLQIGSWLQINGEAIYNTTPWRVQNQTGDVTFYYTHNAGTIYAIGMGPIPNQDYVILEDPIKVNGPTQVTLLGYGKLVYQTLSNGTYIQLPPAQALQGDQYFWGWVIKLVGWK